MSEAGVAMDEPFLRWMLAHYEKRMAVLAQKYEDLYEAPLWQKGSGKAAEAMIGEAVDAAGLQHDGRLVLTPKEARISYKAENINLCLEALDRRHPLHRRLRMYALFAHRKKIVASYLIPLLRGKPVKATLDQRSRLIGGISYPNWFIVPSALNEHSDKEGGTKQGRITCSQPALQTLPSKIKRTLTTRFDDGVLLGADLSQIELRVAALLSGDPVMLQDFAEGKDPHTATAINIFGAEVLKSPRFREVERQVGKTVNFLVLYRGGAHALQSTIMKMKGMDFSLHDCQKIITQFYHTYSVFGEWQKELIHRARKDNVIELPPTGVSRLFLGSPDTVEYTYGREIVNLPIQATAANVLISAHHMLWQRLHQHHLKAVAGLNIYDAIYVDTPAAEEYTVRGMLDYVLKNTEFLQVLSDQLGRTVPIEYEIGVLQRRQGGLMVEGPYNRSRIEAA